MTKKEENQQNLNTSFKIKLTKKEQVFDKDKLEERIRQLMFSTPFIKGPTRTVKLYTNQAGMDLFNEALQKEFDKMKNKNEHRKKLSFRSKIFKQTYKFR